jgi:hypothetical protein
MQTRVSRPIKIVVGILGVGLMMTFVIGLAKSVAVGFAGFKGALPLLIIVGFVCCLAIYDMWEENIKKRK